jgi:hypothetical protein
MTYRGLTTQLQGLDDLAPLEAEEKAASIDFDDLYWDMIARPDLRIDGDRESTENR